MARSTDRLPEDDPDVIDMEVARILAMSPGEVRAECLRLGLDPARLIAAADEAFERATALVAARAPTPNDEATVEPRPSPSTPNDE